MNMFQTIPHFAKMLRNLDHWLEKATAHAKNKSFDADVFVQARLAPDQYPLVRQVQSACDAAKLAAALLSGKDPPAHPDTEKTMTELHTRIQTCIAFLETIKESDFVGAEDRKISPKWLGGKWLRGEDYLLQASNPNFYFHVTTAYAILRHNGVDLGKMDYIGSLPVKD
jgi:hypothetical protein